MEDYKLCLCLSERKSENEVDVCFIAQIELESFEPTLTKC